MPPLNGTGHPPLESMAADLVAVLVRMEARLAALEANTAALPALTAELEGYRPLLDMVKERAERGTFAARFGRGKTT